MKFLTTYFLGTLLFFSLQFHTKHNFKNTGMGYYIIPNKQTACQNNFGNGLSFFFEQVGGYEETAEVEQVSKILRIDLSVFQDVDYEYSKKVELEKHWHNIDTFTRVVHTFISKIKSQPNYYKRITHNPDKQKQNDEFSRLIYMQDTAQAAKILEQLQKQPYYYYPPDYGYLSKGRLLKDLQILKHTLDCYKKSGVTKIRLEYS
ncbi:MAG: hypothetical protein ABIO55_02905 [Ginsengibacter sp.]